MKLVIAGGGVAGLTVGALLSRTGSHDVTVLERAQSYGAAGYGLGLYPLGGAVFNALGIHDQLEARATTLNDYTVHGTDGAVLQTVDLAGLLQDYGPMLGITRADLIDLLAAQLPDGALRFGCTAVSAEADGDSVSVVTEDGERVSGDVVVAADGMHSRLRTALFGNIEPHDTGFDAWMWWAPPTVGAPNTASEWWGPSCFVGLYPMPGKVNVAVGVPRDLSPDADAEPAAIIDALRREVLDHCPGLSKLDGLWDIVEGRPFLWKLHDVRAPQITALDGRVALAGDSGIGFLPTAGVGASNALRAGAALAYELSLADASSVPAALARWQRRVQKTVEKNQTDSRHLAKVMMVRHKTTSALINTLMKHMPITAMTKGIVASMAAPF